MLTDSDLTDEHGYIENTTVSRHKRMLILAYIVCAVTCVCWALVKARAMTVESAIACVTVTGTAIVGGLFVAL